MKPDVSFGATSSFPVHIKKIITKHHFRLRSKNYR